MSTDPRVIPDEELAEYVSESQYIVDMPITCAKADALRPDLAPASSITNWIGGEILNPELPPITATTWATGDGTEMLRDELDARGCRHFLLTEDGA